MEVGVLVGGEDMPVFVGLIITTLVFVGNAVTGGFTVGVDTIGGVFMDVGAGVLVS
jgi:hypothetical protein